jgi:hypothetical protein
MGLIHDLIQDIRYVISTSRPWQMAAAKLDKVLCVLELAT